MAVEINKLLHTVVSQGASDLHLAVNKPPLIRLDGKLVSLRTKVLEAEDTVGLMKSITSERCQQELQERGSTDFGFAFGDKARFRVAVFRQRGLVSLALRLIPSKIMTVEEIGLPSELKKQLLRPRGLFLVTGPTGSGKTTTLATFIDFINQNTDNHIITIEDPIEYYHEHKRCLVSQREIGVDVPGFAEGLRRALRQDPDVILVGEMRDLETIGTAITAAETGHLVFGTVHTTGARGTVTRIIDVFPEEQQDQVRIQLASSLIVVISQTLIPRVTGRGRVAAFEIMMMTPAIQNLIRMQKTYQIDSEIQTGRKVGMIPLDDSLIELYRSGVIAENELMNRSQKPEEVVNKLRALEGKRPLKLGQARTEVGQSSARGGT